MSQVWRHEVQNQGVSKPRLPQKNLGRDSFLSLLAPGICNPCISWLVGVPVQSLPALSQGHLLPLCLHIVSFLCMSVSGFEFIVVQSLSRVWLFATPWTVAHQAYLSFTISWSLLNSCPLSWWCHPTISSLVAPFSCLQSFPALGSFLISRLFASGDQSIGASASVLSMSIQGWFLLRLTCVILD